MSNSKPKYAPKPWMSFAIDHTEINDGSVIMSEDDESLRICMIDGNVNEEDGSSKTKEQVQMSRANQRLLLASPDMIEVLQKIQKYLENNDDGTEDKIMEMVDEVIAKALGE